MGNTTWMCSASLHTQTHIHWSAASAQTQCDDATPISCMNTITWFYTSFVVVVDVIARTVFTFSILYTSFFVCRRFIVTEWTYWNFIKHDCVVLHSLLSAFGTMQFASIENDNCDASNSSEMRWTEKECEFIIRLFAAAIEMPLNWILEARAFKKCIHLYTYIINGTQELFCSSIVFKYLVYFQFRNMMFGPIDHVCSLRP